MFRISTIAAAVLMLALISGCASPPPPAPVAKPHRTAVTIAGAPNGTILVVDGVSVGDARTYDGNPRMLGLESGTHRLEFHLRGKRIYTEQLFLNDSGGSITVVVGRRN